MDSRKKPIINRRMGAGLLVFLLALLFSPSLRAQVTTDVCKGDPNCGKLGKFENPVSVTVSGQSCTYTKLQIDLNTGGVWVQPDKLSGGSICPSQTLQTGLLALSDLFIGGALPASPPFFPDGVFEVTDFNLVQPVLGTTTASLTLEFLPNADNTPIIIRSTGATGVTINTGTTLSIAGKNGGETSGTGQIVRGAGGQGGPGGYRGGDGGNGGVTPTRGMSGLGPGGGLGGLGGTVGAVAGPTKFLTVGVTLLSGPNPVSVPITGGADLASQLRGGSGGGGGGGRTNAESGRGGGGGGGAILIAANNTIIVNGTLTAKGGNADLTACLNQRAGSPGTGGLIRLAAATVAGIGGSITAAAGNQYNPACSGGSNGADNGLIRLEAYNITITSTLTGPVAASSAPGQILMPTANASVSNPFVRFGRIKQTGNASNCVSSKGPADSPPCNLFGATTQTRTGRTGVITSPDAVMPNSGAFASTVDIDFIVGPVPGFPPPPTTLANPKITLVVAPLDPAQGDATNYQADILSGLTTDSVLCPASDCKKILIPGVTLPLGFSSMTAFVVLNLTSSGTLARMFPKMYQGEEIQNVRLETTGSDTKYTLIAKSGKEFPYRPGGSAAEKAVAETRTSTR